MGGGKFRVLGISFAQYFLLNLIIFDYVNLNKKYLVVRIIFPDNPVFSLKKRFCCAKKYAKNINFKLTDLSEVENQNLK